MVFKFIAVLALVAVVSGKPGYSYEAPGTELKISKEEDAISSVVVGEVDSHPQYSYNYAVHDAVTGDSKTKIETRDGDVVHGEYSLLESDGFRRIVKYTADGAHGFQAVVSRQPVEKAVVDVPVALKTVETVAPVIKSVPVAVKTVEKVIPVPLAYGAPLIGGHTQLTFAAPAHIKSIPIDLESRSVIKPTLTYVAGGPTVLKSVPLTYGAPAPIVLRSAEASLPYAARLTTKTVVKSSPLLYSVW